MITTIYMHLLNSLFINLICKISKKLRYKIKKITKIYAICYQILFRYKEFLQNGKIQKHKIDLSFINTYFFDEVFFFVFVFILHLNSSNFQEGFFVPEHQENHFS